MADTAKVPSASFGNQLQRGFRIAVWAATAVALFVIVVAGLQAAWIYREAEAINPALGWAWLGAIAIAVVLLGMPIWRFFKVPQAVRPPAVPTPDKVQITHLRREVKFLIRYLSNCRKNPRASVQHQAIDQALTELRQWESRLAYASQSDRDALYRDLGEWTFRVMPFVLRPLDDQADRLIYQHALQVGLATAVSPNGTLDAFVVLWRSLNLISELAVLYYGRPGLWGTLMVARDVAVAAVMAGTLQRVTDSLGSVIASSLGGVTGVVAGPAVQGVTNGLVMIRLGYLARQRCRSYREWDNEARQSALLTAIQATQHVSVGLTAEILRQVGIGLGTVAGVVAGGVGQAARSTAEAVGRALQSTSEGVASLFGRPRPAAPPSSS